VTILLMMDPRKRVFATYPPTANPVLCIGQGCYVSGGAGAPAEYMPRFSALGPANSIGRRAGPCRNQLTCVFRDVELGGGYGQIQPVDMGLLHHDRREIRGVRPDPTCDLMSGRLFCAEATVAKGYRAWIVPEVIATKAGAEALREALALGLPTVRSVDADPWHVRVHAESSR
jgi:colicin import membrane protein